MKDSFGLRLRYYRTQKDLTQQELSEKSGVSRKQISDFEMDIQKNPRLSTIKKLADALEIKEEKLSKESFEFIEDDNVLDLQISNEAHKLLVELAKINDRSIEEEAAELLKKAIINEEKEIALKKLNSKDGDVVISKDYYEELLQIKSALRDLSKAVLDLEKHSVDFEAEEFVEKVTQK
jgi:transcriptional regulator with XRE-family HTH domain